MISGQYVRTHGVIMNGIPLPLDAPDVAAMLRDKAGYRTALIGKAHFDPHLGARRCRYLSRTSLRGRGFQDRTLASRL